MRKILFIVVFALNSALPAYAATADPATSLRAKYVTLRDQLTHNQFQLPLHLDSQQNSGGLRGDIYAVVDYSFTSVASSVQTTDQWCSILFLHLNVKYCGADSAKQLTV